MSLDLQPNDVTPGMDVWFFERPKDHTPTLRTTVGDMWSDRGKYYVQGTGLHDVFPIYHFRKANAELEKYSSAVPLEECDDLFKRSGI